MIPHREQFQAAINRVEKLSPAPRILARAMVLLRDSQSDIGAIADLIGSDPALTADIIRCANSAYYAAGGQIETIDEAIQKIGFRETVRLLNLAVSRIVTSCDLESYGISADDFWAESLFHGLFLEALAQATGGVEPGEAHVSGLLRYIGRVAINQSIHELGGGVHWFGLEPVSQWEIENLGITQSQAGALLLRRWQFPHELVMGCEGQEHPALLPSPSWLAAAMFFASSILPQEHGAPFSPVLTPAINSDFMRHNGLTAESVEAVFTEALAAYEKARSHFG
jgi:HD-like signal output (HDOD) protein